MGAEKIQNIAVYVWKYMKITISIIYILSYEMHPPLPLTVINKINITNKFLCKLSMLVEKDIILMSDNIGAYT